MTDTLPLLLIIRTIPQQGEKILSNRWLPFIDYLRNALQAQGEEAKISSDELLVFRFQQGLQAFNVLLSALADSKKEHDWQSSSGPCPLQIVVDIVPPGSTETADLLPDDSIWANLHHEVIYLAPALEKKWPVLANQSSHLPEHTIQPDGSGLSRIIFTDHDIGKRSKLLAFRALPVVGKGKECFYCGMTSHHVSQCPSKLLRMATWGLAEVGYQTFNELNATYKKVFPANKSIIAALEEGIEAVDIRKNQDLRTFISFFDISAVYQPRFLWNFAFSGYSQWDSLYISDRIKIDNRNLHLGLDCLRVGQHEQALEILEKENRRKDGDRFAAHIGLAFCSLELNRQSDMLRNLKEARNLAHQTKEIIYCNLLLSRYYQLYKDFWSAKEAVNNAMKADYDCLDVQYRRVQLAVREGLSNREFKQLRSLIVGQKEIFIKALLDPQLLPIQGLTEEILSHQYSVVAVDARKNLANAKQEVGALEVWLQEDDRRQADNEASLAQLEKQLERHSYFDLLDVSERSSGLFFNCHRLRKDFSERQNSEFKSIGRKLDGFRYFWKGYPYKSFFKKFQAALLATIKKNQKAALLLKKQTSKSTLQALALAKEIRAEFEEINREYSRLIWMRTALNGLKLFAKRLLITEFSILILLAVMLPLVSAGLVDQPSLAWLAELAADKTFQRNALIISTVFISPFISLAWTMLDLQNQ